MTKTYWEKRREYILLDFGICRPADKFTPEVTATGSIRTRAPELFTEDKYEYPYKVDVWALGATVFNALIGRFPLFKADDDVPRISSPEKRKEFEDILTKRVTDEWEKLVDLSEVDEPIRSLLEKALEKNPERRCTAKELAEEAEKVLSAFLRKHTPNSRFSPEEEILQLQKYLPEKEILNLMPMSQKEFLKERLIKLRESAGISAESVRQTDELMIQIE